MIIDITKLPKKLNDICYFKKQEKGVKIYNYSAKAKDTMMIIELEECEIEKDFAITGATLEMVRKLSPTKKLEILNNKLVITSDKGTYKGTIIDEILSLPNTSVLNSVKVNLKALKVLSEFVADNDKKPVLCGVNIKSDGTMVATDSFKLARYLSVETTRDNGNIIIPKNFIDLIKNEADEEIELSYNMSCVIYTKENITYISNLIGGNYPNVDRLFSEGNLKIDYEMDILKQALDLSRNVGIEAGKDRYLPLVFENGKLIANGVNEFETILNEDNKLTYKFALNIDSLDIVIKNIDSDKVLIDYTADNKPLFVKDNGIEYILLPIKL